MLLATLMALLMLLLVLLVLQELGLRKMPRFGRVLKRGAGPHDTGESPSFAVKRKVGVQRHGEEASPHVDMLAATFFLAFLVGAGTVADMG